MLHCFIDSVKTKTRVLVPIYQAELPNWIKAQNPVRRQWVSSLCFLGKVGQVALIPDDTGHIEQVLVGQGNGDDPLAFGAAPALLPPGDYRLDPDIPVKKAEEALLAWGMGSYRFERYKSQSNPVPRLVWPEHLDSLSIASLLESIYLARDMINVPAEDMGPPDIAATARQIAKKYRAKIRIISGDALLKENYPSIHAVGRAAAKPPQLIDLQWGSQGPSIVLVGKGVCFDSGGLDIKGANDMLLMKKDMGGAALMLGLAQALMAQKAKIRLRVLIPAVENAIAGNAYRPLDVIKTRKGLTVEIGNTDAEGRVILCDALWEASQGKPDIIIDAATLTGAARIALGTELPALFGNHDGMVSSLVWHGEKQGDPLWRMPLFKPYRRLLDSKVADLTNSPESSYAGAITAALYLQEFVSPEIPWLHIDTMAWNLTARPGRPAGGEAFGLRALLAFILDLAKERKIVTSRPAPRKRPLLRTRPRRRG